jgi:hypothetical protein
MPEFLITTDADRWLSEASRRFQSAVIERAKRIATELGRDRIDLPTMQVAAERVLESPTWIDERTIE